MSLAVSGNIWTRWRVRIMMGSPHLPVCDTEVKVKGLYYYYTKFQKHFCQKYGSYNFFQVSSWIAWYQKYAPEKYKLIFIRVKTWDQSLRGKQKRRCQANIIRSLVFILLLLFFMVFFLFFAGGRKLAPMVGKEQEVDVPYLIVFYLCHVNMIIELQNK